MLDEIIRFIGLIITLVADLRIIKAIHDSSQFFHKMPSERGEKSIFATKYETYNALTKHDHDSGFW